MMTKTPRKAARALRIVVAGTVRVKGHAHHQCVGLPVANVLFQQRPARVALGADGAARLGAAQQAVAAGHAGALQAKVKS